MIFHIFEAGMVDKISSFKYIKKKMFNSFTAEASK